MGTKAQAVHNHAGPAVAPGIKEVTGSIPFLAGCHKSRLNLSSCLAVLFRVCFLLFTRTAFIVFNYMYFDVFPPLLVSWLSWFDGQYTDASD